MPAVINLLIITSQLDASEAQRPSNKALTILLDASSSLPCSGDVITGTIYSEITT